jgi:hypothetical protein
MTGILNMKEVRTKAKGLVKWYSSDDRLAELFTQANNSDRETAKYWNVRK